MSLVFHEGLHQGLCESTRSMGGFFICDARHSGVPFPVASSATHVCKLCANFEMILLDEACILPGLLRRSARADLLILIWLHMEFVGIIAPWAMMLSMLDEATTAGAGIKGVLLGIAANIVQRR